MTLTEQNLYITKLTKKKHKCIVKMSQLDQATDHIADSMWQTKHPTMKECLHHWLGMNHFKQGKMDRNDNKFKQQYQKQK